MATKYTGALTGHQMDKALLDMNNHISEAWAVGERDGTPVTASDETYHNNAKYYAEQTAGSESVAQNYATQAGASAAAAAGSASNANLNATAAAGSASAASASATTAANQAVRAKDEADRAEAIVGGQFVTYGAPQSLTEGQQKQARDNIGAKYSNPNLLDNWWFGKGVVNQRGFTSATVSAETYIIDRWCTRNRGTYTLTDSGLTLTPDPSYGAIIRQKFERFETDKEYTVSVMFGDGTTISTSIFANGGVYNDIKFNGHNIYAELDCRNAVVRFGINFQETEPARTIKAVKLELGSVSTLANDSAPNPATELLKCMRYFYRLANRTTNIKMIAIGANGSATQTHCAFRYPVQMRTAPAMTYSALADFYMWDGTERALNMMDINGGTDEFCDLRFGTSGSLLARGTTTIWSRVNSWIDFSADL